MVNNTSEAVGVSISSRPLSGVTATTSTTTSTTTTMTLSSHHTYAAVVIADPVDDVERTAIGIPVRLLWVPYIIFTAVILVLIMVSFCKFHRKHGHKYRRRRMELFQQGANMASIMNQLQGGATTTSTTTGSTHLPPNGGAPSATCNTQMPSTSVMTSRETNPNSSTVKKKQKARRKQRPLTFMRNANGSMVDLRCGERNSMNIFKTPFSTHAESSIWTLPSRSGAYRTLNSPTGNNYFSDEDDDDVLLIHSTKL